MKRRAIILPGYRDWYESTGRTYELPDFDTVEVVKEQGEYFAVTVDEYPFTWGTLVPKRFIQFVN